MSINKGVKGTAKQLVHRPALVRHSDSKLKKTVAPVEDLLEISDAFQEQYGDEHQEEQRMCLAMDKEGRIISVNEFCAEQLGYRVKELVGKPVIKIIYNRDRNPIYSYLLDNLRSPTQGASNEFFMVSKEGNVFLARCCLYTMHNSAFGNVLLMVSEKISDSFRDGSVIRLYDELNYKFKKTSQTSVIVLSSTAIFVEGVRKILESESDIHMIAWLSDERELNTFVDSGIPNVLIIDTVTSKLDIEGFMQVINEKGAETEVILLLPDLDDEFVISALNSGVKGFLVNKTKSEKLVQAIRLVSRGEIWADVNIMKKIIMRLLIKQKEKPSLRNNMLTKKETEIIKLVAEGHSNKAISKELFVSEKTVKTHLNNIYKKLGVNSRFQLAIQFQN